MWETESDCQQGGLCRDCVIMVVIVGFNVGGDRKGMEWHGWFSRWVNDGRSGRCKRWGSDGFFCWYERRYMWCWWVLVVVE